MMEPIRYAAAACQTDLPNPLSRADMRKNTDRVLAMIDHAVAGALPFLPVKLLVFPEFAGYSGGAMWEDLKMGMDHLHKWKRVALVTTSTGWCTS
ncbi:MAG: hypothetical protein HC794_08155 [Nitrospiraceae bacterium]|nr:hypothetical protein [Nitrospiraceae bacterium]